MAVTICKDGKSLITSTLLTTSMPSLEFYRLYAGRGTSGQLLRDEPSLFMANNNLVYADFCLPHGIYTFQRGMSQSDEGLSFPAGHSLSVDLGTLRFEMGHVPQSAPVSGATMVFSSLLPFQINYDDWRVYRSATAVPANWNANDFDDAAWDVVKAADIGIVGARHLLRAPLVRDPLGGLPRAEHPHQVHRRYGRLLQRPPRGALQPARDLPRGDVRLGAARLHRLLQVPRDSAHFGQRGGQEHDGLRGAP